MDPGTVLGPTFPFRPTRLAPGSGVGSSRILSAAGRCWRAEDRVTALASSDGDPGVPGSGRSRSLRAAGWTLCLTGDRDERTIILPASNENRTEASSKEIRTEEVDCSDEAAIIGPRVPACNGPHILRGTRVDRSGGTARRRVTHPGRVLASSSRPRFRFQY